MSNYEPDDPRPIVLRQNVSSRAQERERQKHKKTLDALPIIVIMIWLVAAIIWLTIWFKH
jgi:hypothetical protein